MRGNHRCRVMPYRTAIRLVAIVRTPAEKPAHLERSPLALSSRKICLPEKTLASGLNTNAPKGNAAKVGEAVDRSPKARKPQYRVRVALLDDTLLLGVPFSGVGAGVRSRLNYEIVNSAAFNPVRDVLKQFEPRVLMMVELLLKRQTCRLGFEGGKGREPRRLSGARRYPAADLTLPFRRSRSCPYPGMICPRSGMTCPQSRTLSALSFERERRRALFRLIHSTR